MPVPHPHNEDLRLAALQQYRVLDSEAEATFNRLATLAARVLDAPMALVSLIDADRQWTKACIGVDLRETARDIAFCAHTILSGDVFVVPDATLDERFIHNPLVTGDPHIRFYAGAPLLTPDGLAIGSLCVLDTRARHDVSAEQLLTLQDLAAMTMEALETRLTVEARAAAESQLHLMEAALANATDAVLILSADATSGSGLRVAYVNAAFERQSGYAATDVEGRDPAVLWRAHRETTARLRGALSRAAADVLDMQFDHRNGNVYWAETSVSPLRDAGGQVSHLLLLKRDNTDRRREEEHLRTTGMELAQRVLERTREVQHLTVQREHDALHDTLTGLPNWTLFNLRLQAILRSADPTFAVLYLDCDRFKVVNETLGHSVGDALLVAFARRLEALVRPTDTIARLGGDEFVVLLESLDEPDIASLVAERFARAFTAPFQVGPHTLYFGASIGVVVGGAHYQHADDVMRDADIAMYSAKRAGRGAFVTFHEQMRPNTNTQLLLEAELRAALAADQLTVHFQPIVHIPTSRVHGFEALVRWPRGGGMMSPAEFLPIAEETGLIVDVDRWVLREACRHMAAWRTTLPNTDQLTLSVNLSSQQFTRPDLVDAVRTALHASGFPAELLKVEITEGLVMERSDVVTTNIAGLKALGVGLHIDDFGTGYSSLGYLQRFDAQALKIDRSFMGGVEDRADSAELVRTITAMAHNLGLSVVAEGVETRAQLALLRSLGCEYAQGFLLSRPIPVQDVPALLERDTLLT
ncbi:putative bifunctional diguanylate cyclase/phosphodiesterase [Deinococcus maricopensis]|uniref:Diguanylate cyclase/phosphodiesterase with PAS/PAC and GAF sensor(S) n=1 Tax=Deinococcus maricopensis (strain DSM 21211 / LMG 22137 / NRRL B-23946 / LB-34) TaxID=709986 RepID=E8U336_DEIML|nr:EAL domain-containing protein [Deinococcus maricopensis]ADV65774.1 diguanylate cyclase/phosphodiesterase with PAS/PAC and GAF sensor(s) [Deinococcus maricopensis DSM 21211]